MQIKIISCEALKEYLDREDSLLIDLREQEDYEKGHLPGAVWADWEMIEDNIEDVLSEKRKDVAHIILYCDRGNISLITARDLARHGYPVISLGGGYMRCGRKFPVE